ncbi:antA/AntB antirepressor family protein [Sulfuricurvum sp.]|uniref:antA/AntB antirepressor family protein n=1 Tax=Sulfuricurvum sp. TaxID=2025608 RepID=UPI002611120D|nr:antA/AntB antirepressor family protein [Sulfuricurvum sp.]MDD2267437.1 antA/AntB antirepressor family protein [Sulfuricurvum sp.]MDD2782841.1 antA/AntB antirepressor family protein [Sulfuricurvum sp.]
MQIIELHIKDQVIGTELIKTVNARELHASLGARKDFSSWIKGQINNLGLDKGVDYASFTLKGERAIGGTTSIEYTLSLDAAKHIAMVSRTPQGKIVRTYLIEIEKRFWAERGISDTPLDQIARGEAPSVPHQVSAMVERFEKKIDDLEAFQKIQYDAHVRFRYETIETLDAIRYQLTELQGSIGDKRLTPSQRKKLYERVLSNAKDLSDELRLDDGVVKLAVFSKLKEHFNVDHYTEIPSREFDSAIDFVDTIDISKKRR